MSTPREIRRERLKTDYEKMCRLENGIIEWTAALGEPPFVERYLVTIHVRSVVTDTPTFRDHHRFSVE